MVSTVISYDTINKSNYQTVLFTDPQGGKGGNVGNWRNETGA
jgi:hypothetical protein